MKVSAIDNKGSAVRWDGHEVLAVLGKGVRASPLNKDSKKAREGAVQQFGGITSSSVVQSPMLECACSTWGPAGKPVCLGFISP